MSVPAVASEHAPAPARRLESYCSRLAMPGRRAGMWRCGWRRFVTMLLCTYTHNGTTMLRPRKIRLVQPGTAERYYKPRGIPLRDLAETVLSLDGLEALRLADAEGLEQADAAEAMGISRSTFSRLLAEARTAVAAALATGQALRIEGGPVATAEVGGCRCPRGQRGRRFPGGGQQPPSTDGGETET
jgi:predicted DNA-binding protein (UPF0251 family)